MRPAFSQRPVSIIMGAPSRQTPRVVKIMENAAKHLSSADAARRALDPLDLYDVIAELDDEERMVKETVGPDADGLALIAYLQWLGTWTPELEEKE